MIQTKRRAIYQKHGVSFSEAETVFIDPLAIQFASSQLAVQPNLKYKLMKDEYDFSHGTRGAILSTEGMTHIHLYVKDETIEGLRKQAEQLGTGYQTLINGILKKHLESKEDISDLPLESQPLNKDHPMWKKHQQTKVPS